MVVLGVMAVALGVGVPVFSAIAANSRMSSATNELLASLRMARSEALTRRARRVVLCPTPDGAGNCVAAGNLGAGWTVFLDNDADGTIGAGDVVLQRHAALGAPDLVGGLTIAPVGQDPAFNEKGELADVGVIDIQLCDSRGDLDTGGDVAAGRWIQIGRSGQLQLARKRVDVQVRNPLGGC
jgi:Tfp pilus assembly protein FimT